MVIILHRSGSIADYKKIHTEGKCKKSEMQMTTNLYRCEMSQCVVT
jgi:hypothetical protein